MQAWHISNGAFFDTLFGDFPLDKYHSLLYIVALRFAIIFRFDTMAEISKASFHHSLAAAQSPARVVTPRRII